MSSRSLDTLDPRFRPKVDQLLQECSAHGLDMLVYCTLRSSQEQDQLYQVGRTKPGKIVTNAKAGQSAHNFGMAIDAAPLVGGKIAWNDHEDWALYGELAARAGLEWAGTWKTFKEMPHVQLPNWQELVK